MDLTDVARHVIEKHFKPSFLESYDILYDVASYI